MDTWALIFLSLSIAISLYLLLIFAAANTKRRRLPPGPPAFPIIGNLHWLSGPISNLEPLLLRLFSKYGPILTLHIGSRPFIYVNDRDFAHKLLINHGAVFANRPKLLEVYLLLSANGHNINTAAYGPLWRLLRRNLMSEILNPSSIKLYSHGRNWVLGILLDNLRAQAAENNGVVVVMEAFQYAMFCILVLMCFGEKQDEKTIRDIGAAQRAILLYFRKLQVFAFFPGFGRYVFAKRWQRMLDMRNRRSEIFIPLINSRRERKKNQQQEKKQQLEGSSFQYSYVDSLLDLKLTEDNGRELNDEEIVSLCSEFLNAGTDTTSTVLQWIMANIVKHQHVQARLLEEINGVLAEGEHIEEEELQKMPYLKAVIMEGLRRHPPGHFVLPHAVTEEISVDGYVIPKDASLNFTVAEMGWDGKVWKDPLEFKPERFLPGGEGEGVDITGSREIKMMPFGVGRRICPGLGLAMLHLEYFVANLVRVFDWKPVDGKDIDLSEKPEFAIVMKNPLQARVFPRV